MANENDDSIENDLQMLEKGDSVPKMTTKSKKMAVIPEEEASLQENTNGNNNPNNNLNNLNNYLETEEVEEVPKYQNKLPLELDLSDLAAALLQNNKK